MQPGNRETTKCIYTQYFGVDLHNLYAYTAGSRLYLPIPATFVLQKGTGKVIYKHCDPDYISRATPQEIVDAVQQANTQGIGL